MASSPCRAIESGWTLVGTYLDLALAYLCLCAATVSFLAAKFLALFGVSLPCSCGGQVSGGHLHHHRCCHRSGAISLQALLLDYPTNKIAGVHMTLRRRFSLDSLCHDCRRMFASGCCFCSGGSGSCDVKLVNDDENNRKNGGYGNGGEGSTRPLLGVGDGTESCGSVSKPPRIGSMMSLSDIVSGEEASKLEKNFRQGGKPVNVKGKGVVGINPPSALPHRRRGRNSLITKAKSPRVSPSTPLQLGWPGEGATRISVDKLIGRATSAIKYDSDNKDSSCEEKIVFGSEINELSIIGYLKQALEEEKSTNVALLLELEKERNWAATAADEAMAMISRLQEEKATIEMEARQYKRMTDEKSAYDDEELDILKEIIVRRERETYVLEKEIESYREMMLSNNGASKSNAKHEDHQLTEENNLCMSSDETELMLKEIYRSIKKKEKTEDRMQCLDNCKLSATKESNLPCSSVMRLLSLDTSEEMNYLNHDSFRLSPFKKKLQTIPNLGEECKVQEKDMLNFENCATSLQSLRSAEELHRCRDVSGGKKLHEPNSHLPNEQKCVQVREIKTRVHLEDSCTELVSNADKITSEVSQCDEASIVDVHVIDDITDFNGQGKENDICLSPVGCASNTSQDYNTKQQPFWSAMVDHTIMEKLSIHKSRSDSTMGLSDRKSYPRSSWSDLRSSMSSVDSERGKLENEIGTLRKRLKIIQEGREKLSDSLQQRENEMYHLQVLEEIACQLQEIRKATETEKSLRRASLPHSSSWLH